MSDVSISQFRKLLDAYGVRYRAGIKAYGKEMQSNWKDYVQNGLDGEHAYSADTTGRYGRSIVSKFRAEQTETESTYTIEVGPTVKYAPRLEEKITNVSLNAITRWARAKSERWGVDFNPGKIYNSIRKQGTKPWNMLEKMTPDSTTVENRALRIVEDAMSNVGLR